MKKELTELLLIILPIIASIIGVKANKYFLWFKTTRFKLADHMLFSDLLLHKRSIKNWNVAGNRRVFLDALEIKFCVWRTEGIKLANKLQKNSYNNTQLENAIIEWANETIDTYTEEWRNSDIPEKVIQRITSVHEEKVEQFVSEIKLVVNNNDMYPFKIQKVIAVFGTLRILLADTKDDFNRLVYREKYNGQFTDVKYKGIPVSDVEYKLYIKENE